MKLQMCCETIGCDYAPLVGAVRLPRVASCSLVHAPKYFSGGCCNQNIKACRSGALEFSMFFMASGASPFLI